MTITDFERDILLASIRPIETTELILTLGCSNAVLLHTTLQKLRLKGLLDCVFLTADILTEWKHDGFVVYRTTERGCIAVSDHDGNTP